MNETTRVSRRRFRSYYGGDTFAVVSRIISGQDSRTIEAETGVPVPSVAAYRANVTRGTYYPWVDGYSGIFSGAIVPRKD
jgi:hypothetical protein